MFLYFAVLLLLLVPATSAAGIPNQGDLAGAGAAVINKGGTADVVNAILGVSRIDELANARRADAGNLVGPIGDAATKLEETASEAAKNVAAILAIGRRDEDSDALSKDNRKINRIAYKLLHDIDDDFNAKSKRSSADGPVKDKHSLIVPAI
ncbi:hypothetical protein V493_04490 [Pseudogymnoascus sp. VKM F-4281 (FW-2241)]|nr:hypothetical protein V493_04490 [Pseudogymnoascus sp. VKM F-4281 (FW-2241)]